MCSSDLVAGAEFLHLRFELVRKAQAVRFGRFIRALIAIRVARRHMLHRVDQHRLELAAPENVAAGGKCAERIAVITLPARDDVFALRLIRFDEVLARELQRCFDGFGAAARQPHFRQLARRIAHQIVRQQFCGFGREEARVRERELVGLDRKSTRLNSSHT